MRNRAAYRRAPYWVRSMPDRELHSMTGRLLREGRQEDLSSGQDWLIDVALADLAWRRREALRLRLWPCSCWLCMPPDWE